MTDPMVPPTADCISPTPPGKNNFNAVSLGYLADALDADRAEARTIERRLRSDTWLDSDGVVVCLSPSVLPPSETGVVTFADRYPDHPSVR